MINVLVFLSFLFILIIYIRFHTSIKKLLNKFNKNSKDSIITGLLAIFLGMIFFLLQLLNKKYNISPFINAFKISSILFIKFYIPSFFVFEFFRYKIKKCNNIIKVICIDMIFGEQILFNFVLFIIFVGLYQYKYNIMSLTVTPGASNIINTLQTIIVTFFITLNFSKGYNLYENENNYKSLKPQLIKDYSKILIALNNIFAFKFFKDNTYINDILEPHNKKIQDLIPSIYAQKEQNYLTLQKEYQKFYDLCWNSDFLTSISNTKISKTELSIFCKKILRLKKLFYRLNEILPTNKSTVNEKEQISNILLSITEFDFVYINLQDDLENKKNNIKLLSTILTMLERMSSLMFH